MTKPRRVEDDKDKEDAKPVKGNIDAELVLWAVKELNNYDKAVVVSGDGDFYSLVEYLEEKSKLETILAPNNRYSSLYNKYQNFVHTLENHRGELNHGSVKNRNNFKKDNQRPIKGTRV